jgi:outer membrane protein assembly factor BamE (lipoprotein component of BamABCDE complex)
MRRRRILIVQAGLVVALFATVVLLLWPRPDLITRENIERIREGMSREEMEAILGAPGDYRTRPAECIVGSLMGRP